MMNWFISLAHAANEVPDAAAPAPAAPTLLLSFFPYFF